MDSIQISGLGKAFKSYSSQWSLLFSMIFPGATKKYKQTWILKDISFSVRKGEAVGIIGINGAGKSTLLKLIAGTLKATNGTIITSGNLAAILELGMGFHPDFTGRQNLFLAGHLLGMKTNVIEKLIPDIETFAEIGEYIDKPVRVYSSGMQMRLAFSLATAQRPDILIIDEALSVGDTYFQHKSFDRIKQFRKLGTTLLIVSHDKNAIVSLCDRAILLDGGRLSMVGEVENVLDYYNALLANHQKQNLNQEIIRDGRIKTTSGTFEVSFESILLLDKTMMPIDLVYVGQEVKLRIVVKVHADIDMLVLGYGIKDKHGKVIYGTNTYHTKKVLTKVKSGNKFQFDITFKANLGPGDYSIVTALHSEDTHLLNNYEWRDLALIFSVINKNKIFFEGSAWIEPDIIIKSL